MNLRVDVLESLIWPAAYCTNPPSNGETNTNCKIWIVNHLHLSTREAEKRIGYLIRSPWAMLLLALFPILVQCAATLLWNRTLDWIGRSKWPSGWSIPVTGVSNGQDGRADLILTKDNRPPSPLPPVHCCCNRNAPDSKPKPGNRDSSIQLKICWPFFCLGFCVWWGLPLPVCFVGIVWSCITRKECVHSGEEWGRKLFCIVSIKLKYFLEFF